MNIFSISDIFILSGILLNNTLLFPQVKDTIIPDKNIVLEEITIIGKTTSAEVNNLTGSITTISGKEIKGSASTSLQDLLEELPGIDIRQRNSHDVQADIQFRGGTFDQVMILLNGINITDPQTGHFNLNLPIEISLIERIEIIHGIQAVKFGANAYKGVINIITKKENNSVSAGLSYGQYNLWHPFLTANLKKRKFYNGLSLSRNSSDGYTENTDFRIDHLFYQGGLGLKSGEIEWQAGLNSKAFGANDFYSPSFPDQYEETLTGFGSAGITSGGKSKISVSASWRRHKDHFLLKRDDPSFYENYHLTDIFGMKAGTVFTTGLGSTSIGFQDRYEIIHSTLLGNDSEHPKKIIGTGNAYYTKYFSRNFVDCYLKHDYSMNNFFLSGGFMITLKNDFLDRNEISPGINISRRFLNKKMNLFASVNKTMRLPTFTDLFYKDPVNEGNPYLDPEELVSVESGLVINSLSNQINLAIFKDFSEKSIDWVWIPERNTYKAMNISEITTGGFEISCRYNNKEQDNGILSLKNAYITYTFISSEKTAGDFESKYSLDYLKHKLGLNAQFNIAEDLQTSIRTCYNARNGSYLDFDPDTNTTVLVPFRSYWLTDMKISYERNFLKLFVNISNLLDTEYTDVGNLIQPGRWIVMGMEINFPVAE